MLKPRDLTSPSLHRLPAAPTLSVQLQHERLGVRFVVRETFRELRVVHIVQIFAGRIAPGAPTERVEPAAWTQRKEGVDNTYNKVNTTRME